jgi:putative membrane protein
MDMTTIENPPPASTAPAPAPPPHRSGFYVAPWVLAVLGGIVILGVGFVLGRAVDRRDDRRMGPFVRGRMGDDPGGRGFFLLALVVLLVLLVTGIVLLGRHFSTSRRDVVAPAAAPAVPAAPAPVASSAEQVLADRFARGEIDEAEFVSRRNALRG